MARALEKDCKAVAAIPYTPLIFTRESKHIEWSREGKQAIENSNKLCEQYWTVGMSTSEYFRRLSEEASILFWIKKKAAIPEPTGSAQNPTKEANTAIVAAVSRSP